MTNEQEFSRPMALDTLGAAPRTLSIEASADERGQLAKRFGIPAIDALCAELSLTRSGDTVTAVGRLSAQVIQSCVASREPVAASVDEAFHILFRPRDTARQGPEEVELSEADCDVVFYDGASIDVGEAVAETLSLNLDPWPRSPGAEEALKQAGVKSEEEAGPFAALAALKDRLKT